MMITNNSYGGRKRRNSTGVLYRGAPEAATKSKSRSSFYRSYQASTMEKIEHATHIMEAFANSNTVTTQNSSRLGEFTSIHLSRYHNTRCIYPFMCSTHCPSDLSIILCYPSIHLFTSGKYMELFYTGEGDLVGGSISTYLLEHVRVTKQLPGERNFHIFYELIEGKCDGNSNN